MLNKKIKSVLFLAAYSCVSMAADDSGEKPSNNNKNTTDSNKTIQLDEIEVKAKRLKIITPLPACQLIRLQQPQIFKALHPKKLKRLKPSI